MAAPNRRKLPLILFGSADSDPINNGVHGNWFKSFNITVTTGQTDPIGGTAAVLVDDTVAGGGSESMSSPNFTLTKDANGEVIVQLFMKAGSSADVDVNLRDATAGVNRHIINIAWSGGVPTPTSKTGSGTVFTVIAVGGGWYLIRFSAAAIVSGNTHNLWIYPASTGIGTGSVYVYLRSAILFGDPLDMVRAWSDPREGSEFAKAASGLEDVWIVGTDEFLQGEVRWIPGLDVDAPFRQTGWDGRREVLWVNAAWKSFLEFGRTKQTWVFVPDQSDADAGPHTCYLVEPMEGEPDLEPDMTRTFELLIRDSSDVPFEGY